MNTIKDLISNAVNQKPTEFADTFNNLVLDRIHSSIEAKKQELAGSLLGQPNQSEVDSVEPEDKEEQEDA